MTAQTVFIVDDDPGIRLSIPLLLETANLQASCFASAEDFLRVCNANDQGCLLLDVRMPGKSGPMLQEILVERGVRLPIIFLTAYADISTCADAMKRGAMDFLTKPINGTLLLQRIQAALELNRKDCLVFKARSLFEARLNRLTSREREVLVLALSGMANRDISNRLQISQRTIEGHRSRIYLKTGVGSLLELAQQAANNGVLLNVAGDVPSVATA